MRFEPKSEAEVAAANLIPGGEYPFEVVSAEEQISKSSGNDMIKLVVGVSTEDGGTRNIFDYLVGSEGSAYKVRGFAVATGHLDKYDNGELKADEMVGWSGWCRVGIQKDKTGQYPDKNVIRDYFAKANGAAPTAKPKGQAPAMVDEDIPFFPYR
jgi:hypothetical protein